MTDAMISNGLMSAQTSFIRILRGTCAVVREFFTQLCSAFKIDIGKSDAIGE